MQLTVTTALNVRFIKLAMKTAPVSEGGLADLDELSRQGQEEPLARQLFRESWQLKHANRRSSIILGAPR